MSFKSCPDGIAQCILGIWKLKCNQFNKELICIFNNGYLRLLITYRCMYRVPSVQEILDRFKIVIFKTRRNVTDISSPGKNLWLSCAWPRSPNNPMRCFQIKWIRCYTVAEKVMEVCHDRYITMQTLKWRHCQIFVTVHYNYNVLYNWYFFIPVLFYIFVNNLYARKIIQIVKKASVTAS